MQICQRGDCSIAYKPKSKLSDRRTTVAAVRAELIVFHHMRSPCVANQRNRMTRKNVLCIVLTLRNEFRVLRVITIIFIRCVIAEQITPNTFHSITFVPYLAYFRRLGCFGPTMITKKRTLTEFMRNMRNIGEHGRAFIALAAF